MKRCEKCGEMNYRPEDKCLRCGAEYKKMSPQCTPDLGGQIRTGEGASAPNGVAWRKSPDHTGGY